MANEEHLNILKQGIEAWNEWRKQNESIRPDLSGADLRRVDLSDEANWIRVNLSGADLSEANLNGADLRMADLSEANLNGADLSGANLRDARLSWILMRARGVYPRRPYLMEISLRMSGLHGADLSNARLNWADLRNANLRDANLHKASLSEANISGADLIGADLSNAYLSRADLRNAKLRRVNLSGADLTETIVSMPRLTSLDPETIIDIGTDLCRANLTGAKLDKTVLVMAKLGKANLRGANLRETILQRADLSGANLQDSTLSGTNLNSAYLIKANLSGASLSSVDLHGARLGGADLSGANLYSIDLTNAELRGASLERATCRSITFPDTDLSTIIGLDTMKHKGPSSISIGAIFQSQGKLSETFLRGCGVPEDFLSPLPLLVEKVVDYYSCFISYSHHDGDFVERLYSRLIKEKLRVWYDSEDMQGGKKMHEQIYSGIKYHDKFLLVLSEYSIHSEWVMTEIRKTRKEELANTRRKLFPIRLTNIKTLQEWECFDADMGKDLATEVREFYIPDFSEWKNNDKFEAAFQRLLRDLKASDESK